MTTTSPSSIVRLLPVLIGLLFLLCLVSPTAAQSNTAQLGIRPVDSNASYIDLTLEPGATQELSVELGNYGTAPVMAHTFLADVYSLVNGGMGVALDVSQGAGASGWVDYPEQTLTIDPRSALRRSFTLHIPSDTQPGEYLTSIVLQGEAGEPSATTGVAIKQVVRHAMAIAVTVPGPRTPGLSVGSVSSSDVAGHTYLRIELKNTGNVRLQPEGEIVLRDQLGAEISRYPISMGSLYAGTSTFLEVPFAGLLNPGSYQLGLSLHDPQDGQLAEASALPVQVAPTVVVDDPPVRQPSNNQAPINQVPTSQPANQAEVADQATSPLAGFGMEGSSDLLFVVVVVFIIVMALLPMFRRRRR
ncbi:MAG: hypothetical protein HGA65_01725 [Oscillochloris sp.]|nr:hypothetical protein [Oscillochloris sp.]